MKIKKELILFISVGISLIIAGFIIFFIPNYFGQNELYKVLTQGEVLVGIVVAVPTLSIWFFSIQDNSKKFEAESALAVLEIKKEYDLLLKELCSNYELYFIIFPYRLQIIFDNFENTIKPFDSENRKTYLDYEIVLKEIFSGKISYESFSEFMREPKKVDNVELIGRLMKIMMDELKKAKLNDCIQEPFMQDFLSIQFRFKDFSEQLVDGFSKLRLVNKFFYNCTFDTEFIKRVDFEDCKFHIAEENQDENNKSDKEKYYNFIESAISDPENHEEVRDKICQLLKLDISFFNDENESDEIIENVVEDEEKDELKIQDVRDKILLNTMILQNKYFTLNDIEISDKELVTARILDNINNTVMENVKKENVRISISKNYVNEENINEYGELVWLGWNSIMENYLDNNPNIEYFVFGVKGATEVDPESDKKTLYYIVFNLENFKALLEKKTPHGNGKYHFYFAANKKI